MPAIKITQEIKDKNKKYGTPFILNNVVGKIVNTSFPSQFYLTEPFKIEEDAKTAIQLEDDTVGIANLTEMQNYASFSLWQKGEMV